MLRRRGFTLIELMITVAIVAILAAIVLPSYTQYVKRGKITDATSALAATQVKMEQYFQDWRSYNAATAPSCLSSQTSSIAPAPPDTQNFHFTCFADATTFLVTATGINSMVGYTYTINQTNTRVTLAAGGWPTSASCWVLKQDGSC